MTAAAFAAYLACAVALGGWFGVRWSEANQRHERNLAELVLSIDIDRAAEETE